MSMCNAGPGLTTKFSPRDPLTMANGAPGSVCIVAVGTVDGTIKPFGGNTYNWYVPGVT